jgi:hypothetical protein
LKIGSINHEPVTPSIPMLIISPFSDYYDGVASSGIDTTIRYRRTTKRLKAISPYLLNHLPQHLPDSPTDFAEDDYSRPAINSKFHPTSYFGIIGFCGTTIVYLHDHQTYHFGEAILTLNWSSKKRSRKPSNRQVVTECIQKFNNKTNHDLFKEFNVPIFTTDIMAHPSNYEFKHPGLYLPDFILNPSLSELKFYQHKDPYSTFQEIQSYISGILGITTPETIELSDKSKILKAGFDPKTSFRKGKQTKA